MTRDGAHGELLRGGVGSVVIKAAGMVMSLAAVLLLARMLGPNGFGVYAYVFALVGLLAVPAQFGLPPLIVRETSYAEARCDWNTIKGLWCWSILMAAGVSILVAILTSYLVWRVDHWFSDLQVWTFRWGLILLPVLVFCRLFGAYLRGLRHVVLGQVPDNVLRPGLLLVWIGASVGLSDQLSLSANTAMAAHALAAGISALTGIVLLMVVMPVGIHNASAKYCTRIWTISAVPLMWISGMHLLNTYTDLLILGMFSGAEQVGVYRIAVQGATLVVFGLQVVNAAAAPLFARLYTLEEKADLQRLATTSSRASVFFSLPIVVVFLVYGEPILNVVVGPEYIVGAIPLAILCIGQLVNAFVGPVDVMLNMAGQERVVARTIGFAAITNLVGNVTLIPVLGMIGAAIATALSMLFWNAVLAWEAQRRLNVFSPALGARWVHR